tara:strand:- start:44 stop:220 length:177 start_codon:yes stop_codon:yes gene_type:complete
MRKINITDYLSKKNTELVSEMVKDALIDMGIINVEDEDPSFPLVYSWNVEVDYEDTQT